MTAEVTEFDLCGPLPQGTTVLEASAGTGKTYAIAGLAARYIAEGRTELSQLLLVTFGRMATNELRSRVRERLVRLEAHLSAAVDPEATGAGGPADDLDRLLLAVPPSEQRARHERVARALADFDAAPIATTHEFCLQMLDGLGVLGDREPDAVFVDQVSDLTREVTTDLFLRRYAATAAPPLTYPDALRMADRAVAAVHARLVPAAEAGTEAAERVALAVAVRSEVTRRKRAARLFTYDDMLTRLRDVLVDPERGAAAIARLQSRYRVVMVDEFQDTDPVQWEILRLAFHGSATLILIGDPKQAIYAFRGADVYSYVQAVTQADRVGTLATNRRSDVGLVDALGLLFGDVALGEEQIRVRPVAASQHEPRLRQPTGAAPPVRLRVVRHQPDRKPISVGTIRPRIAEDLVADITGLLSGGAEVRLGSAWQPLQPEHLAVLVRTNDRGERLRDALVAAGVPAVMHGATSVFASDIAQDWLTLLVALEQPRQVTVRRAALTCFVGWTFADLATATEDELIELAQRVRGWSRVLASRGVAALLEAVSVDTAFPERLLGTPHGERQLTDVRHLAQSLHAAMTAGQLGTSAVLEWLRGRIAEARSSAVEAVRRLETDAKAVTVLTVHRSKGLEFPVVYLPDAWDRHVTTRDEGHPLRLHSSPAAGDPECLLDVGGRSGPDRAARFTRHRAEDDGEDLRLLYVALTRAQCQVVTWWAPTVNTPGSALQRFLYRPPDSPSPAPAYALSSDPFDLPPRAGLQLESMEGREPLPHPAATASPGALSVREFRRRLDLDWRRTSYSALTAAVHGLDLSSPGVGSEPESVREDDEPTTTEEALTPFGPGRGPDATDTATLAPPAAPQDPATPAVPDDQLSPMSDLPTGAEFGLAVHSVFELTDPAAADLGLALTRTARRVLARSSAQTMTAEQLAAGLTEVFRTPLGPLAEDRRLCDITRADQLSELGFELELAGGDQTTGRVTLGDLAPLLRRYLDPTDPLAGYADQLSHPQLADQTLRGYLTGSIDAVLRIRRPDGEPRYLVVDYKTNWLGPMDGSPLRLASYRPDRMAEAMIQAHYPLQALLYSVAVHRFLRWRQPGYAPEHHLGGVLYLFVRGMAGPDTPRVDGVPYGVFSWLPPAALVTALSDLLDGVTP